MQLKINGNPINEIETEKEETKRTKTGMGTVHADRCMERSSNQTSNATNRLSRKSRRGIIVVNDLTLVVTKRNDEAPVIKIEVEMAPLDDGTVPEIEFVLTKTDLRKSVLTSVIHNKMIDMYPDEFYPDAEVIINNYATEIRKDVRTFEEFKDDSLYTLQYTFMLETGIDD